MQQRDARSLSSSAIHELRGNVVAAVRGGMKQVEAARIFKVSRTAIAKWLRLEEQGGGAALVPKRRGRPSGGGKLRPWQAAWTARLVVDHCPDQLKLPFVLWTRQAVAALIRRQFGITYGLTMIGRLLRRWGFTPQKPMRRAFEKNSLAVKRWLEQEYPALKRRAKREGGVIFWGDEMGVRSDHQTGTSYAPKGKTPVIGGTGRRFSCNMISALTNRGNLNFMVFTKSFTVAVYLKFLRRLIRQAKRKVFLIMDGHPVHKARRVAAWLAAHRDKIEQHLLPAYSPELNPDEYLNNDVKANAVGRRRAGSLVELKRNVSGYMRSTQRKPDIIRNYFKAEHVRYAAS